MTVIASLVICGALALLVKAPWPPRPEDVNPAVYEMLVRGYI